MSDKLYIVCRRCGSNIALSAYTPRGVHWFVARADYEEFAQQHIGPCFGTMPRRSPFELKTEHEMEAQNGEA